MWIAFTLRYHSPRIRHLASHVFISSLLQLLQLKTYFTIVRVQRMTTTRLSQRWRSTIVILITTRATMIRPLARRIYRTRTLCKVPFWPCPNFSRSIEVTYNFYYYIYMRPERAIVATEPPFSFVSHYAFEILYDEQRYMYIC